MPNVANLRNLAPAEIDTILADTEYEAMKVAAPLTNLKANIRARYRKSQDLRYSGRERARALEVMAEYEARLPKVEATVTAALVPFQATISAINDEFVRRGGWARYFLVCNTGGHVHKTRSCSSCFNTTEFAWLPGASGQDGAGLIAMFGSTVCSVCFPEAPIDALKAAEKEAKKAAAKADGQCDGHGQYAKDNGGFVYCSPRGECPVCGRTVSTTSTGKCRKHKS